MIYVLDNWQRKLAGKVIGPTRQWNSILGACRPCVWEGDPPAARTEAGEAGVDCKNATIIVHRSFFTGIYGGDEDLALKALRSEVERRDDLVWIVVSGDSQSDCAIPGKLYFRNAPVEFPTDEYFGAYLDAFLGQIGDGCVDFQLLEPERTPENLLAIYLLASATAEDCDDALKIVGGISPDIWRRAKEEFVLNLPPTLRDPELEQSARSLWGRIAASTWPDQIFTEGRPVEGLTAALKIALRIKSVQNA